MNIYIYVYICTYTGRCAWIRVNLNATHISNIIHNVAALFSRPRVFCYSARQNKLHTKQPSEATDRNNRLTFVPKRREGVFSSTSVLPVDVLSFSAMQCIHKIYEQRIYMDMYNMHTHMYIVCFQIAYIWHTISRLLDNGLATDCLLITYSGPVTTVVGVVLTSRLRDMRHANLATPKLQAALLPLEHHQYC